MAHTTHTKPLHVIILGASISGLATAYGLQDVPGVHIRLLEKRKEDESPQVGYPIRLSPDGRQALKELLTPQDHVKVLQARAKLPACHDGITMLDASGRITYRKVDSPGEKPLIERQDLINLLRSGLSPSPRPAASQDDPDNVPKLWAGALELGEVPEHPLCDCAKLWRHVAGCTRIGADEDEKCVSPFLDPEELAPDLELNSDTNDKFETLMPTSVQVEYGKSVRAITKTSKGWKLIMWDGEIATCDLLIGADGMFSTVRRTLYPPRPGNKDPGFQALPLTIINVRTTSAAVRRWVKDPDGMNMVYGRGWSAALAAIGSGYGQEGDHGDVISVPAELDARQRASAASSRSSTVHSATSTLLSYDPRSKPPYAPYETYVALTLPHPRGTTHQAISALPGAQEPGTFLSDLLADEGLTAAQAFPLWSARRTSAGAQRAVLIGDASHGMLPYCGAGASAGLKDASELVTVIQNHKGARHLASWIFRRAKLTAVFGGDLDFLLDEFCSAQKPRNDPVIKKAKRNLWLVQGDSLFKRAFRAMAFALMERMAKLGKARADAEDKLAKWKRGLA